jgi:hypothetical protein
MSKFFYTVVITPPNGERTEIPIKKSVQVKLEERLRRPIMAQVSEGYIGAPERLAYEVGVDNGVIPKELSFDDFIDSDEEWVIDLIPPEVDDVSLDGQGNA